MLVHDDADCIWLIWPRFSGWFKKFCITEIAYLAGPRDILEPPSVVFSVCKNFYQKLVFCWHVYDRCTNCKFINWYANDTICTINTMYSTFDWKEFELLSHRQAFLESAEISASEETNGSGKAPVQIMPLWKLSGKFHFLVRFYTSNWNRTYTFIGLTQKSRMNLEWSEKSVVKIVCFRYNIRGVKRNKSRSIFT